MLVGSRRSRGQLVVASTFLSTILGRTYLAMMLPGKAMLSVCCRPLVGLKTAEGFEVSTAPFMLAASASFATFRFYIFRQYFISYHECCHITFDLCADIVVGFGVFERRKVLSFEGRSICQDFWPSVLHVNLQLSCSISSFPTRDRVGRRDY